MRKTLMLIVAAAALAPWAVAQNTAQNPGADTPGEKNLPDVVDIQGTPEVKTSPNSATINWKTNNVAATDVHLEGGEIKGHRTQYNRGGTRDHTVTFDNLKPSTTYTYKIRSGKGDVRYQGTVTTLPQQ